jgi:hypothetical protein
MQSFHQVDEQRIPKYAEEVPILLASPFHSEKVENGKENLEIAMNEDRNMRDIYCELCLDSLEMHAVPQLLHSCKVYFYCKICLQRHIHAKISEGIWKIR